MGVTDNKELVKKLMASANEITIGIVAPLPLTVLKTIEVCIKCVFLRKNCVKSKNVCMNVSSLN